MTERQAKAFAIRSVRNGYVRLIERRGCEDNEVAIIIMIDQTSIWFASPTAATHSKMDACMYRFYNTEEVFKLIALLAQKGYKMIQ